MNAKSFKKAVEKATFAAGIDEIIIKSDGETGTISTVGIGNDRLAHVTFPFEIEGEWGISDPDKLIKSLGKIKGDLKIDAKDDVFIMKGDKKRYKFPVVDDLCGMRNVAPFTPSRKGSTIYFNEKVVDNTTVSFTPKDIKDMKAAIKSEKVYEEKAIISFSDNMEIYGGDDTDFAAGDTIEGEFQNSPNGPIQVVITGIEEVMKVCGNDISIHTANDSMVCIEDYDEDVTATYIILPILE